MTYQPHQSEDATLKPVARDEGPEIGVDFDRAALFAGWLQEQTDLQDWLPSDAENHQ